jgi:hypothetical protein
MAPAKRRGSSVVPDLVTRAPGTATTRRGTRWRSGTPADLVDLPSARAVRRRHRGFGQSIRLKLVDQLETIRVPAALPRQAGHHDPPGMRRIRRAARGARDTGHVHGAETIPDDHTQTTDKEGLLAAERHAALREAFTHLPSGCQQPIALLIEYPPPSNAQISARPSIPVRSIAPAAAAAWRSCAATWA